MDKGTFKKLGKYHVIFLSQNTIIGIALFSLPHELSPVGYDQWLIPILYGILATISVIPMIALAKKYPDSTLFAINEKLLGNIGGKVVNFLIMCYVILHASAVVQAYVRILQVITFPEDPITNSAIAIYFVMIFIIMGGIKSIARFCMFAFFFTAPMIYFLLWAFQRANWTHAYPTFSFDWFELGIALDGGAPAMFGYALLLFYFPYIKEQKKAFKHITIGIWIAIFFYVLVCFASVIYFSEWQLEHLLYPVLNLLQAVHVPFAERIETFGVSLWIFLVLSTSAMYLWVAKKGMDALFSNFKNKTWHLYVVAFISIMLFIGPIPLPVQKYMFEQGVRYTEYAFLLLPNFLLLLYFLKKKLGVNSDKKK
ncbi:GerAB/ArcD/ProY family transporter [Bacillus alkalicellulosilyticus]|uniref:GerAB/ArcD/ProY family transporter n=1 Tax=Alkalihalobacterium alkalicellulosilyticum TaxID=1912214 RepID=UPI00099844E8|nr:GerAB/ArcD/ProY family transporter [Bacillus alkalicellulosilyticus]